LLTKDQSLLNYIQVQQLRRATNHWKANMLKGIWIIKSTHFVCGKQVTRTYEKCRTKSEANKEANNAIAQGHSAVHMYFHEYDEDDLGPAYGSFSERLEYDFSQN